MKVEKKEVEENFSKDLFWTRTIFTSDDDLEKSEVLMGASQEYFDESQELSGNQKLTKEILDKWLNIAISKWLKLGKEIFEQDVHFDFYATSQEGEANGIRFLLTKVN